MPFSDRLTVIALHQRDADEWRAEYPELADDADIIIADGRGWDCIPSFAVVGYAPTAIALGLAAAADASIGGTEPPRRIRLAVELGEHRRRHVLKEVAA